MKRFQHFGYWKPCTNEGNTSTFCRGRQVRLVSLIASSLGVTSLIAPYHRHTFSLIYHCYTARVLNSCRTLETILRGGRIISQHLPKLPLSHHGVELSELSHVWLGACTRKRYKRRWDFSKSIITYFPSFSPSSTGLLVCFVLSICTTPLILL